MGLIINKDTHVIVQGGTGKQGSYHVKAMLEYGTKVVAGVTPGRGGNQVGGLPVYDTVREAKERHKIDASLIMVPAPFVLSAAIEAIDAGVPLIVIVTEHIPVRDTMKIKALAQEKGCRLLGPNTIGVINCREKVKIGIMPGFLYGSGKIGLISRSGTLSHETASNLMFKGLGVSTVIGIGGDQIIGTDFVDALKDFKEDQDTEAVVMLGEIGGNREEKAAEYLQSCDYGKPVFCFIAGRNAPPGKKMGHAGAIIQGSAGTVQSKEDKLRQAGVRIAVSLEDLVESVAGWRQKD
ncbi:succinyl-CoA synthetase (ADP-forming) alpha subunit [Desulfitobacterium sp. LBE]|uniref:Succinyl-CoA ligase [ADP-forming] subunit alpha 1 n=2 Tax=root TaxID=1 RepID=A0A098AXS4_DESHA|nr:MULTISPECIES: succinate--CoA ligase subunit alpha [Desulfitobacterium]MEA5021553.1 succinate--CoA ligase subunit alpha [Desulfitobacterium hafniense]TWH57055.1 succinyl-CoA synthetase (ADP-forming) alpha subunit [Desulfitobacterium sp. LBE]CDX00907.1 Succinyl-CoA ligase [ADP-forming] subunit alpha 1 [Desulfitobacterium hafniense]